MCGRFSNKLDNVKGWEQVIKDWPSEATSDNVAPSMQIPVYTKHGLHMMRWGLVPSWSKDPNPSYSTHNAKLETVAEKATFRSSWAKKRTCLIPTRGYFEWKGEKGNKQKFFVENEDGSPIVLAGIWSNWQDEDQRFSSCTILTTTPTEPVKELHHRMPIILSRRNVTEWLATRYLTPHIAQSGRLGYRLFQ